MNNVWFIADTHFGHNKILEFQPKHRPFSSLEEHDEELIRRWNEVVKPNDVIFHLGDFCLGGKDNVVKYGSRLNGRKRLVMGNHDVYRPELYLQVFDGIYGSIFYKEFILSHVPLHSGSAKCIVNLHGHLHSKNIMRSKETTFSKDEFGHTVINSFPWEAEKDPQYFCVSVEQNNLSPIHIEEIRRRLDV